MKTDVIVIGAGVSGLTAAQELREHGYHVTVLERESYPGGRIYTDNIDGAPIDRGAYLLHGISDNPLVPLAEQVGAEYTSFLSRHS